MMVEQNQNWRKMGMIGADEKVERRSQLAESSKICRRLHRNLFLEEKRNTVTFWATIEKPFRSFWL